MRVQDERAEIASQKILFTIKGALVVSKKMPIENREVNEEKVDEQKAGPTEEIDEALANLKEGIQIHPENQEINQDWKNITRLVDDTRDDRYA